MTEVATVARLRAAGWATTPPATSSQDDLPMLAGFPRDVATWVSSFSSLVSPDEMVWFLSAQDYAGKSDGAFAWNEMELISRDAAMTHEQEISVRQFWSHHLPVLLSVRDGYSYVAVRADGVVVYGEEPEFEEVEVVAPSFASFLDAAGRPGRAVAHFPHTVAALIAEEADDGTDSS